MLHDVYLCKVQHSILWQTLTKIILDVLVIFGSKLLKPSVFEFELQKCNIAQNEAEENRISENLTKMQESR